jgi:hypothetical protein
MKSSSLKVGPVKYRRFFYEKAVVPSSAVYGSVGAVIGLFVRIRHNERVVADPDITPIFEFRSRIAEGHCATLLMTVNQLTLHRLSWLRQDSP